MNCIRKSIRRPSQTVANNNNDVYLRHTFVIKNVLKTRDHQTSSVFLSVKTETNSTVEIMEQYEFCHQSETDEEETRRERRRRRKLRRKLKKERKAIIEQLKQLEDEQRRLEEEQREQPEDS